ncbi:MAG: glycoside hydrolase, family 57 [Hydrocarboniphaga sp.]|uniref:glycoside hydrolase family 57 protein n=1 Tax=Hydrocarboniphaga sp. TaxID=2033016 RepID=UPI002613C03D|nr:glycoside hydrolase family 57 protein [Hydrocarboniphaga sp.]MDB5973238.1 glycoside hydrolase, family 57 [Hydrocarboniphaga sp.]
MSEQRLRVVVGWHMHQPEYRDPSNGVSALPWTYLHAIKDYSDMAAHLENEPGAKAVVNFAPLLLEQIEGRAATIRDFLASGASLCEPMLEALVAERYPADPASRLALIEAGLRSHPQRLIERFGPYQALANIAEHARSQPGHQAYLSDAYIADLVTWLHLAWIGETIRRHNGFVQELQAQGHGFSLDERRRLLALIGEICADIIPRYRRLAESGRVELTITPYGHPIVPLMLDLKSAKEAMPDAPLPESPAYPGGEARARWHFERGLAVFERCFGFRPVGCWCSEGSISEATLDLLPDFGFSWTASGANVLAHSVRDAGLAYPASRPIHFGGRALSCLFRDDELSDAVGFRYQTWHADDAIDDLVRRLEQRADEQGSEGLVLIYLDGENAWEFYPMNAYWLLSTLYRRLANHPRLKLTTVRDALAEGVATATLPRLTAGSWVYGTFSTWIGSADKNRGWDLLVQAKQAYDSAMASKAFSDAQRAAIDRQLAVCEASDWFWWLGDYNPGRAVSDFESLYRLHLRRLFEMLGLAPPQALAAVLSQGQGDPAAGGTMRANT